MLYHVVLDGVEVGVRADPGAAVPRGYWLDGRFHDAGEPLVLYEGAVLTTTPPPRREDTAFVVDVVGGLHAGRSFPLPRRRVIVGRAPGCDIVIDDPTVSPRHALIDEHRCVHDLGSVNGTRVDHGVVHLGATQLRIRRRHDVEVGAGPYHRPPRPPLPVAEEPPVPPAEPSPSRTVGVAAIAGPALMGGALVVVYGDLRFALLALMAPLLGVATLVHAKHARRRQSRAHRRAMRAHEAARRAHRDRERARLEQLAPDPCMLRHRLWERRPWHDDFGVVRLGLDDDGMPVLACGTIGITGDGRAARALARSLVVQAAMLHGSADLHIDWSEPWAKWLPHRHEAPHTFTVHVDPLPSHCTTVVMVDDLGDASGIVACGMSADTARDCARWLARFEDPERSPALALPAEVRASEVDGIAVAHDGVFDIDLVRDGPHALLAGTTGSGKSELLRTIVARLAATHTPDEMVFVLVDYKGGSAFDECARLPHCVGLVTDLDEHLGERALRSLEAELRHRERVQRAGGAEPRLVVVIDEFATLAAELPDFLHALIGIAQRGRSLGMHLVLATQRPSGAVGPDIKANTNLRIALRVQDPSDSTDVIGIPDAATIDRATPGRAYVRRGNGDVVLVQTATTSRPARAPNPVELQGTSDGCADGCADRHSDGPSELQALVDELTRRYPHARPRQPWLPMLPAHVDLEEGFALADEPEHQRQVPVTWRPADGNLALFGVPGSGTTTAMRSAASRVARATVYELDFDHGAEERHARLLRQLMRALDERRRTNETGPPIVVCIDDVGAFLSQHDELIEMFQRLFGEGPRHGIAFVVTATHPSALPMRLAAQVQHKLFFQLADAQDYALIGVRQLPRFVPGRAIHSIGNRTVQVAPPQRRVRPRRIAVLPDVVHLDDLPPGAIGLDEELEPVWLELHGHLLVTGPPRCGKTTALHTLRTRFPDALVVDDALTVDGIDLRTRTIAAAGVDDIRAGYGHWVRELRKSRAGILLQPDLTADGELLGVRLPRRVHVPARPGRGFVVAGGDVRLIQLATTGR